MASPSRLGSPSTSSASSLTQSSSLGFPYFESNWNSPANFLEEDTAQNVYWQIPELPDSTDGLFSPALFVCQTNASVLTQMDSTNTWSIAPVPLGSCSGCLITDGSVQTSKLVFQPSNGFIAASEDVFFFCIGNSSQLINPIICDSFGPTFGIQTATVAARRESSTFIKRQLTTLTAVTYMPTTPLSITQWTPVVSISGVVIEASTTTGTITELLPSSTSTQVMLPVPTPSGLSTAAKAGISIAIVLVFFILLTITLFCHRYQKKSKIEQKPKTVPSNTHELITNANSHELFTKHNIPELDGQSNSLLKGKQKLVPNVSIAAESGPEDEKFESRGKLAVVQELDPKGRITTLNTEDHLPSPHELENSKSQPFSLSAPLEVLSQKATLSKPTSPAKDANPPADEERERKVELLTNRMSRIREEKERLERIQELKDLEEQTKREILAAWRVDGERS